MGIATGIVFVVLAGTIAAQFRQSVVLEERRNKAALSRDYWEEAYKQAMLARNVASEKVERLNRQVEGYKRQLESIAVVVNGEPTPTPG